MRFPLRAGLEYLLLGTCLILAARSAPIPRLTELFQSLDSTTHETPHSFMLYTRPFEFDNGVHLTLPEERPITSGSKDYVFIMAREEEVDVLYRRNKFTDFFHHLFHKIGEGFHRMADGIKHVAHKIGEGFHRMADGIKHVAHKIGEGFHRMAEGIKHVAKVVGHAIVHAAKTVGHAIVKVAKKVGHAVAHVAVNFAHKVVHAAQAVKHFMQTTGARIAKVGLKILSTVQEGVSKLVQFIPVIGKPLSKVMSAEAEGENKLSDTIKVHIGGKLGDAMDKMSKAQKIMKYIPRELGDGFVEKRTYMVRAA